MNRGIALGLAFGAVLVGALVITSGLRNRTLSEVVEGVTSPKAQAAQAPAESSSAGAEGGSSSSGSSSGGSSGLTGSAKGFLRKEAGRLKWSASDWEAVIADESGGNPNAVNPSSGAFGIGQFLGATKTAYARYGSESRSPTRQLNAMEHYILDRYKTPTAALEHEKRYKWY